MESCLQAIDVGHDPPVQFDECGAGLAEASIVSSQLAEVRQFTGGKVRRRVLPCSDQEITVEVWSGPWSEAQ